ncbi:MAG: DUF4159 domain-containing protein [Chitinophagales bacterium]|nr:DUF4159 domain-containing protein [Chitinophagales bacterium]
MKILNHILLFVLILYIIPAKAQSKTTVKIGLMKYKGGGDWYANPTSLSNLAKFCNQNLGMNLNPKIDEIEPGNADIANYALIHITGDGNIILSAFEAENLRNYLIGGGFLHISDNYGLDKYIRKAMKTVFPELEFTLVPFNHPIYHQKYDFPNGVPKIHEHDGKAAQGFGLFWQGRLVCFYDYETDLGDGWEDPEVHNDSEDVRQKALKMGANIVQYALTY